MSTLAIPAAGTYRGFRFTALPFVRAIRRARECAYRFWSPPRPQATLDARATGEAMALHYLRFLADQPAPEYTPLLMLVVDSMREAGDKHDQVAHGFFGLLEYTLQRHAAMCGVQGLADGLHAELRARSEAVLAGRVVA